MSRLRFPPLLPIWLAFAPAGCPQAPEQGPPPPQPSQTPAPPPGPWLYTPALQAGTPAGVTAVPVFELADGHRGRAQIGVAVADSGEPRLEVWEFSQNNQRERLERFGEPQALVGLRPGDGRGQLDAIRTAIARPGNEFVRLRGLEGTPEEIVARLAGLVATVDDAKAEPAQRAQALATLTRALDDHLLFTNNRLPDLLAAARSGGFEVATSEPLGERRVALTLREPPHRLVFARTGDRWALSEATFVPSVAAQSPSAAPAAEPSPTAP